MSIYGNSTLNGLTDQDARVKILIHCLRVLLDHMEIALSEIHLKFVIFGWRG